MCMKGDNPAAQTEPSDCSELKQPTSCGEVSLNYCWKTRGQCKNWATLEGTPTPPDNVDPWYLISDWVCADGNWLTHPCRGCRSWCEIYGDKCVKSSDKSINCSK
jgi:hypothetical protein